MTNSPHVERAGTRLVNITAVERADWTVYIGRANATYDVTQSRFANPFPESEFSRQEAVDLYKLWFHYRVRTDPEFETAARQLAGETLACWCVPEACHGEVILQWLDRGALSQDEAAFICARLQPTTMELADRLAAGVSDERVTAALDAMAAWATDGVPLDAE